MGTVGRFKSVQRHAPPLKTRNMSSSNCWKCNAIVNPTITRIFCIISNLLRSHQGDLFFSQGKGVRTHPAHPPAYGPEYTLIKSKLNRPEQNRTEQKRTEQSRAEQNTTEQNRTEQNRLEQNKTKQNRTEQNGMDRT